MCYPAALCVFGIMASSPTGTKRVPCAAVGNSWASPPSHPHAVPRVWSSGCTRSRGSTSRNVRTVALAHSYGSLWPPWLYLGSAEALLWRCPSITRHEPAGLPKAAVADTITGSSEPPGDVRLYGGLRPLTCGALVPRLPHAVGHRGP